MKIGNARQAAWEFIEEISNECTRIEIAGSVRREKAQVKDVEIVCIPKMRPAAQVTLFGPSSSQVNLLHERMLELRAKNRITGEGRESRNGAQAPFSEREYRIMYRLTAFDVFVVIPPANWWPIFVIRTGSKDFTHWLVTVSKRPPYNIHFVDGHMVEFVPDLPAPKPVTVENEKDLFTACGVRWMEPREREGKGVLLEEAKQG